MERARPKVLEGLGARDGQARRPDGVRLQEHREVHSRGVCRPAPRDNLHRLRADIKRSALADDDPKFTGWLSEKGLSPSATTWLWDALFREQLRDHDPGVHGFRIQAGFRARDGVDDSFLAELERKTHFKSDPRIKFVGDRLRPGAPEEDPRKKHTATSTAMRSGGTNPSLLEALASTRLNLLFRLGFNREVAEDSALYWTKKPGNLASLIDRADDMGKDEIKSSG